VGKADEEVHRNHLAQAGEGSIKKMSSEMKY